MKLCRLCVVFCICVFISHPLNNSLAATTATLSGRVTDPAGLVIAGAKVDVTNVATNVTFSVETNGEGFFVISNIPPGRYRVTVEKQGFQSIIKPSVELHVQDTISLNFAMQIGSIIQSVMVESGAPLVKTETPEVSTLVDRQFVENLPLNGRSFQTLMTLTPGVLLTKTDSSNRGQFSVNGQRADANYFTVDGVSANVSVSSSAGFGQGEGGALPSLTALGGTNNLVSVDALQEFKVQTSTYSAEFGRTPGGQVSIVTRSGTNEFHGTLFEYFRNDVLDANDWFANATRLAKPAERQNDFGGVFSGPILLPRVGEGGGQPWYNGRNRTFFLLSYEGLRLRQPQAGQTTVPSINSRQLAPLSIRPFLDAFPEPNGGNLANNFSEFNASFSNPSTLNATSIRLDHTVNSNLSLFGRYNDSPSETVQRGGNRSLNTLSFVQSRTQTLTGGVTMVPTSTVSNEVRANFSRFQAGSFNELDNFGGAVPPSEAIIFPPFASHTNSWFILSLTGGTNTSFVLGRNAENIQRQVNLIDTLSVVSGSHQFRFGIDYRRLSPIFNPLLYTQQVSLAGVNGALSGRASAAFLQSNIGQRVPVFTNLSLFGQDNWRITKRLTLNYGLRWEVNPAPSEKNGNNPFGLVGIDNPASLALAPRGTSLYATTYNNFAPRVGVSYQLLEKTGAEVVIRGGFGIFYDLGSGLIANAFANSFPNRVIRNFSNVAFPLDLVTATPPVFSLTPPYDTMIGVDPNLVLPRTYQWSLALEQALGPNQSISASYVGALGRRLLRNELLVNPNANFTFVNLTRNSATSDYHALQIQFQRRLSRGFQALASYAWSHSIDSASSDTVAATPAGRVDPRQDRGSSDFDIRHTFNGALTYNIPSPKRNIVVDGLLSSWSLDAIITSRTASPINVITGRNVFGVFGVSRPDLVPGVPLYIEDFSVAGGSRINRAAFAFPPTGSDGFTPIRQGTLGRNALRGFPIWQLDAALRREFKLTERVRLQFKAEAFNLLNHPNFGDPIATMSNVQFGRSTTMFGRSLGSAGVSGGLNPLYQVGGPRSIQFALRLHF